jgi:hypothetical protein
MLVIARPRGSGKTTELIKMSAKNWIYIVVKDHRTAYRTMEMAKRMELEIPFPLTFEEYINGQFSITISKVLIDDAEFLLQEVAGRRRPTIQAITISTGTDYEE